MESVAVDTITRESFMTNALCIAYEKTLNRFIRRSNNGSSESSLQFDHKVLESKSRLLKVSGYTL